MKSAAPPDAAVLFGELIAATDFDSLPHRAVDAAKKSILDTLAVMVAAEGSSEDLKAAVRVAVDMGGRAESTVAGSAVRIPAMMAAFANGAMVHCLDYDDIEYDSVYHPSGSVVPAALALAERSGRVSGKDFITAVALGQDLGIRMARAIPAQRKPPWHRTAVIGTFAAAAAGAKTLRLDAERIVDTLGHALCQAAGSLEMRWGVGTEIGGMYAGLAAKAGVFSALLAQGGVAGVRNALDGPAGFFNLYYEGHCDRQRLLDGIGVEFCGADTALKPWPACGATNTYVLATLTLMREHRIAPGDIECITLFAGDYARKNCEPLDTRRRPTSAPDAKFSLPFTVAIAATRGDMRMVDFAPAALTHPEVLAMADRVDFEYDPAYDISYGMPPGAVRIRTRGGQVFFRKEDLPHGHPSSPLSWDQLKSKATDCFGLASRIEPGDVRSMVDMCQHLESIENVADIASLLRAR